MSQSSSIATLYNPHNQTKQELIDGFVVRTRLFKKLFAEIKSFEHHPDQHFLIEGQRGMGKTTLLLRLACEIENDADTAQRLIPVIFEEEVFYRVTQLSKLWEETAKLLAQCDSFFIGLFEKMDAGYDETPDYERFCFELLQAAVQQRGKKLILLIDNFSELCKLFSEQEARRLREILITCTEILWIGATAGTLEASFRYQHAFYEFFKKYSLTGLNREDTENLLQQLAKRDGREAVMANIIEKQPGRVEALRILTGGVIRTIVLLFEIFTDDVRGEAIHDLERILDRVTPLYKHRMDDLPSLQREVVVTLAKNWDGMAVVELARGLRRPVAEIEDTLIQLKHLNIVEIRVIDAETQWYFLQERFFNIWYLMRLAGRARSRVVWLVRFLEAWYDQTQLVERAKTQIQALRKPEYSAKAALYYAEALAETGQLGWELEAELKHATRKHLELCDKNLASELSPAVQDLFEQAADFAEKQEYESAKQRLLQIKQPSELVYFGLGFCFSALKNVTEAERYYLRAIEVGHADAMNNLALLYENEFKDYAKAEQYYLRAIEVGHADAMYNLALLYEDEFKDYAKAEQYYLRAIEAGHAKAMFNLALLYKNEFKDYAKAEQYYLRAIEAGHAKAIYNLAWLYQTELKDYAKAEQYYLMALDHREREYALGNLIRLYRFLNQPEKAENCQLTWAIEGHYGALNSVAWDYFERKIHKYTALCCAEQAVEQNKTSYNAAHTLACIYLWHNRFTEATDKATVFIDNTEIYEKHPEDGVNIYLLLLLAKQQYDRVRDYFNNSQLLLKEHFKPIYYAFLTLTHDPEVGRMPPELQETVGLVLAKIAQMAQDYA